MPKPVIRPSGEPSGLSDRPDGVMVAIWMLRPELSGMAGVRLQPCLKIRRHLS
jgi:hypothetical protein